MSRFRYQHFREKSVFKCVEHLIITFKIFLRQNLKVFQPFFILEPESGKHFLAFRHIIKGCFSKNLHLQFRKSHKGLEFLALSRNVFSRSNRKSVKQISQEGYTPKSIPKFIFNSQIFSEESRTLRKTDFTRCLGSSNKFTYGVPAVGGLKFSKKMPVGKSTSWGKCQFGKVPVGKVSVGGSASLGTKI